MTVDTESQMTSSTANTDVINNKIKGTPSVMNLPNDL